MVVSVLTIYEAADWELGLCIHLSNPTPQFPLLTLKQAISTPDHVVWPRLYLEHSMLSRLVIAPLAEPQDPQQQRQTQHSTLSANTVAGIHIFDLKKN